MFELKVCITSLHVLARFDPDKPTFLKTDWSSEGMVLILIQPSDDAESVAAEKLLRTTGEYYFDIYKNGTFLKPIAFGSRICNNKEVNCHSFSGKGVCGQWDIDQSRKYLWSCHFSGRVTVLL